MKMQNSIWRTILIILGAFACTSALAAQQLVIRDGTRQTILNATVLEGSSYYRVVELASVLDFKLKESGNNLDIIGDRGSLTLISGRPLVRTGSQYILLSAPVVKLSKTGWWVPEDFLEKLLPNILSRHLVVSGRGEYKVESLNENVVRVQAIDYPDHVSFVFRTSERVSPRIREFRDFIEIRFDQYVVRLEKMDNPDTLDVVSAISFDPNDGLGTFRVTKGKNFGRYREYVLDDPPRVVVDFFEAPRERQLAETAPEVGSGEPPAEPSNEAGSDASGIPASREAGEAVVVIDPGHGGADIGVETENGLMEKNLTLAIARLLESKLEERGIKTRITRNRDVSLSPEQRSSVGNFYSTRAFVSLHFGGSPSAATQGPVVYFSRPYSQEQESLDSGSDKATGKSNADRNLMIPWNEGQKPWVEQSASLARLLQDSLNRVFLTNNRIMEVPITVLEPVKAPAVLLEIGFLTNDLDREFLLTAGYQDEMARLIADGIMEFLR